MVASLPKTVFLILSGLFLSISLFAQSPLLERKVDLTFQEASLEKILMHLSNEADFNFSYNARIVNVDTVITISVRNTPVGQILEAILPEHTTYQVTGNHLILMNSRQAVDRDKKSVKYLIRGYIFDAETGKSLRNVSVFDAGGLVSALSDSSGYYDITLTSKNEQINLFYSKRNFYDTLIIVQPADQEVDLKLKRRFREMAIDPVQRKPYLEYAPVENIKVVQSFVSEKQLIQAENIPIEQSRFAQISVWPNIGTNRKMSGLVENNISVNVLAGYALGVKGFEMGGLVNIDRKDVKGFQIAGLGNIVGGTTSGVQVGGLFNNNRKSMVGLQLAGVNNIIMDTIRGAQISGFSNILRGSMMGWQVAGFNNFTSESVDGVQLSGFTNIAMKDVDILQLSGFFNLGENVRGFQVSGFANVARNTVGGWQISGVTNYARNVYMSQVSGLGNIAADSVHGVQLSTLFNYAKYVGGGQISLFNIADTVKGTPFGLISFVRHGYHKVELSAEEVLNANFSFKMGVRRFYNIFTAGYVFGSETPVWGFGYGIGTQIGNKRVVLNLDLKGTQIMEDVDKQNFNASFRLSPTLGVKIFKGFTLFAGPAINLHISDLHDPLTGEFNTHIAPGRYLLWEGIPGSNTLFQLWAGGTAGLRFF